VNAERVGSDSPKNVADFESLCERGWFGDISSSLLKPFRMLLNLFSLYSSDARVFHAASPLALSSCLKDRILTYLAGQITGQQTGLNLQHTPIADTIVE
jgi:hypothetical protein